MHLRFAGGGTYFREGLLLGGLIIGILRYKAINYKKYGVVVLGGITLSQSGTALKSLGSLVSASEKANIEAIFPQR